jgi:ribosomal protein L35
MKQKTKKCVSKKVKVSSTGKISRRHSGQNHFNAKESGKTRRNKRRSQGLNAKDTQNVLRAVPYL